MMTLLTNVPRMEAEISPISEIVAVRYTANDLKPGLALEVRRIDLRTGTVRAKAAFKGLYHVNNVSRGFSAVSPDGKKVAFDALRAGIGRICILDLSRMVLDAELVERGVVGVIWSSDSASLASLVSASETPTLRTVRRWSVKTRESRSLGRYDGAVALTGGGFALWKKSGAAFRVDAEAAGPLKRSLTALLHHDVSDVFPFSYGSPEAGVNQIAFTLDGRSSLVTRVDARRSKAVEQGDFLEQRAAWVSNGKYVADYWLDGDALATRATGPASVTAYFRRDIFARSPGASRQVLIFSGSRLRRLDLPKDPQLDPNGWSFAIR